MRQLRGSVFDGALSWSLLLSLSLLAVACGSPPPEGPSTGESPTGESPTWVGAESDPAKREVGSVALFEDVSEQAGLDFVHWNGRSGETYYNEIMGAGAALFDFDNDGDLDIYLVQGELQGPGKTLADALESPPAQGGDRLFRNQLEETGVLRFVDITSDSGLGELKGYGMGVATGDFDNDGLTDLYVARFGANQLLRNLGEGRFADVTQTSDAPSSNAGFEGAGVGDPRWSAGAAFVDIDGDGWLDLYVVNYVDFRIANHSYCRSQAGRRDYCGPHNYQGEADRLLRNRGGGLFEDISASAGILAHSRAGLGVVSGDFDLDGRLDLYIANDLQRNLLWLHQGERFVDSALLRGSAVDADGRAEASMGVVAADIDDDGDEDLFMTHLETESNTVYLNDGRGFFDDRSSAMGLAAPSLGLTGFGAAAADFDHDGRLDLVTVNGAVTVLESKAAAGDPFPFGQPNQVFLGQSNGRFSLLGASRAGQTMAEERVSRGLASGDVDNDGDVDLLVTHNNSAAQLLLNRWGQDRDWIGLRLVGGAEVGGRDLLGARVRLFATIEGQEKVLTRRSRTEGSYASAADPRVHFGLGDRKSEDSAQGVRVEVLWPDGLEEAWVDLDRGRYHTLERGRGGQ